MEKQLIDFVSHLFTLEWATWALPISIALSLLSNRVVASLVLAVVAVAVHHAGVIALPVLMAGGDTSALPNEIMTAAQGLEPISVAAEFVAYAFLIVVFSLTRRDMLRPSVKS